MVTYFGYQQSKQNMVKINSQFLLNANGSKVTYFGGKRFIQEMVFSTLVLMVSPYSLNLQSKLLSSKNYSDSLTSFNVKLAFTTSFLQSSNGETLTSNSNLDNFPQSQGVPKYKDFSSISYNHTLKLNIDEIFGKRWVMNWD